MKVLLSSPLEESEILQRLNAQQVFDAAPKVPNISTDHCWECDGRGCRRYPFSPVQLAFEMVNLDAEMETEPQPQPTMENPGLKGRAMLVENGADNGSDRPKRNVRQPLRFQ